jgi:hypothetical protein
MAARMRLAVSTGQFAKHTGDIPTYFNDCAAAYGLALVQPSTRHRGPIDIQQHHIPVAVWKSQAKHFAHELADLTGLEVHSGGDASG